MGCFHFCSCYRAQDLPWQDFRIRGGTSIGVRGERFFDNMVVVIVSIATFLLFVISPHLFMMLFHNDYSSLIEHM